MTTKYPFLFYIFILLLSVRSASAEKTDSTLFDYSKLHEIHIYFDSDNFWDQLTRNFEDATGIGGFIAQGKFESPQAFYKQIQNLVPAKSENSVEYIPATVNIDGDTIESVGVRLKGFSSYFASSGRKKSIKLDFNEFNDTLRYLGLRKINLNNGVGDPSFQRDFISYYMMRKAGVAAPRASFAKLYLNDIYWGLYVIVEQIDKTFLENNFASGKGDLYKAIGNSELEYSSDDFSHYSGSIELKTNEKKSDGSAYVNLVKSINQLNGSAFSDSIQKLLYMDYFFKVLAIDVISKNWDSYMQHGRNFYLYQEPVSDLFYWIPWDYNLAWDGNFGWDFGPSGLEEPYLSFTYEKSADSVSFRLEIEREEIDYMWIGLDILGYYDFPFFDGIDPRLQTTDSTVIFVDAVRYDREGIYPYNINAYYTNGKMVEKRGNFFLTDSSKIKCHTAYNMDRAFFPDDSSYDEVYDADQFCCDCQWDPLCENFYNYSPDNAINDYGYPIDLHVEKPLIRKLFSKDEFKKRYYDAFKFILDSVFHSDTLISIIKHNTDLIKDAVYADTNLIFSTDEFENDIETLCDQNYLITSLTRLIENRKNGLDKEFETLNYTAQSVDRPIAYKDVVINEIMARRSENDTIHKEDWIELYNNTDDIIVLDGLWLSDDRNNAMKFALSKNTVIKPDGFVVVWADNEIKTNGLHANFKLSGDGEDVVLYSEKYDTIDAMSYGSQYQDSSFARFPNGTGNFKIMFPTRNSHNVKVINVSKPEITIDNGFLIYPNPTSDILWIRPVQKGEFKVTVYNSTGTTVFEISSSGEQCEIYTNRFSNGLYILQVHQDGQTYSEKILVKH